VILPCSCSLSLSCPLLTYQCSQKFLFDKNNLFLVSFFEHLWYKKLCLSVCSKRLGQWDTFLARLDQELSGDLVRYCYFFMLNFYCTQKNLLKPNTCLKNIILWCSPIMVVDTDTPLSCGYVLAKQTALFTGYQFF